MKTCKDGFEYDDAMWTEAHAREISSTLKLTTPILLIILGLVAIFGVSVVIVFIMTIIDTINLFI